MRVKRRALGRTGLEISEVGFGAWAIGGIMWGGRRDEDARAALEAAIERGINFFDTALVYGDGHSEKLVGELVRAHPRAGLLVATKVPPKTMRWPAGRYARIEDVFPPGWIRRCCELSLKHLGLDRVDLLQLHVWEPGWLRDTRWHDELLALVEEGKVRYLGISINAHQPHTALELVKSGRVHALQVVYNLFDQSPEDELFPACLQHGVGVLARVPLDEGSLTGKLTTRSTFPPDDFRNWYFAGPMLAETVRRVEALRPLVEKSSRSLVRGALRFCLSHPAVSTVIPGMRSTAQVEENCATSGDPPITAEELADLREHRWVRETY
jgi:aryl-alcohol dehydrogenase-like predicted oxidoreductase